MDRTMLGKTCLVTGASRGIGKATALALAARGARVVLACRDRGRGDQALADIRAAVPDADVAVLLADLSSLAETRALAAGFLAGHSRLDVLVNNAGAIFGDRRVTVDGFEATFATNHLSYFVLTRELEGVLRASGPARIVNVASRAHERGRLDFADPQAERGYRGMQVYSNSKLANVLFTYELARRLTGSGVTANCLHPGVVASHFALEHGGWMGWAFRLMRPFLISPAAGAATSVHLAVSPEVGGTTGRYFDRCREVPSSPGSLDAAAAKRLWDLSEELISPSHALPVR